MVRNLFKLVSHRAVPPHPSGKIITRHVHDLSTFLQAYSDSDQTLIWAVGKETTLETIFGDLEVKSLSRRELKTTKDSVQRAVNNTFSGVSKLFIYGHDRESEFYKDIVTLGETPPRLVLYKHFTVHLQQNIEVVFLEEKPKIALPDYEKERTVLESVEAFLSLDFYDAYIVSTQLLRIFNAVKESPNAPLLFQKSFLKKMCKQILLEKEWDLSSTITEFHVAKACSSILIKELRLEKAMDYKTLKAEIFRDTDYVAPKTQCEKDHYDKAFFDLHDNPERFSVRPGGYHKELHDLAIELAKTDALSQADIVKVRDYRKLARIQQKLRIHSMVIGPVAKCQ